MQFSNDAPTEVVPAWPIRVCRGSAPMRFIILTPNYIGVKVHWWGGRSVPCEHGQECIPCQQGCRADWKGYVGARSTENDNVAIVTLTSSVALELGAKKREKSGMTGLVVTLYRSPAKDTGMLHATTHGWNDRVERFSTKTLEEMIERIFGENSR